MPKLEMVTTSERLQRKLDTLQTRLPQIRMLTRSSFYVILGCQVPDHLSDTEKAWLDGMIDAHIIDRFRCKEREDR